MGRSGTPIPALAGIRLSTAKLRISRRFPEGPARRRNDRGAH
jgi:hypothetical protein